MFRRFAGLALGCIVVVGCVAGGITTPSLTPSSTATFTPTPAPAETETPAADGVTPSAQPTFLPAALEVTVSSATVKVGDEVTITGNLTNMGIPLYHIQLGSGGEASLQYGGDLKVVKPDTRFEVVSGSAGMPTMTLVLRALQPGDVTVRFNVSGEVFGGSPDAPAFSWGLVTGEVRISIEP